MKQVLFGVFAHPDDEGFGPSGTLYKAARSGTDVHLILITSGDNGRNPDGHQDLGTIRLEEWHKSGELIGAASMKALGYKDGTLCNNLYLEIAEKVLAEVKGALANYKVPVETAFVTSDTGGISGHLDHIAASMITTYVYLRLRQEPPAAVNLGPLKYACLSKEFLPEPNTGWLYMPAGRATELIDEKVDISDVWDKKLEIMHAHASQREDMEWILSRGKEALSHEYFWHFKD